MGTKSFVINGPSKISIVDFYFNGILLRGLAPGPLNILTKIGQKSLTSLAPGPLNIVSKNLKFLLTMLRGPSAKDVKRSRR